MEPLPLIPKKKLILTEAKAKAIVSYKGALGRSAIEWVERWLDQFVRERSLPPQLAGKDFLGLLGDFLTPSDAIAVLERIRADFRAHYPHLFIEAPPDFSFVESNGRRDSQASLE